MTIKDVTRSLSLLLIVGLTLVLTACPAGEQQPPPNTTPPTVVSTSPADGATDVAVNASIFVTFSEAMDTSATEAALSTSPAVNCDFSWNGAATTLTCRPTDPLSTNTSYTVTIGTGAQDAEGENLTSAFNFSFTTGTDTLPACVFGDSTFGNCVFGP